MREISPSRKMLGTEGRCKGIGFESDCFALFHHIVHRFAECAFALCVALATLFERLFHLRNRLLERHDDGIHRGAVRLGEFPGSSLSDLLAQRLKAVFLCPTLLGKSFLLEKECFVTEAEFVAVSLVALAECLLFQLQSTCELPVSEEIFDEKIQKEDRKKEEERYKKEIKGGLHLGLRRENERYGKGLFFQSLIDDALDAGADVHLAELGVPSRWGTAVG